MSCDWSPARSRDLTRASHWSARELRPLLVFIWAKILAVDPSCQHDLVRDQSHKYFLTVLQVYCTVLYCTVL